jgi:dihydrofolate synthase/folylpolyglutamate synthase
MGAAGLRVGTFLSPHLFSIKERVLFSSEDFSEDRLVHSVDTLCKKAEAWGIELSPFEILTCAVFFIFSDSNIDLAILEVGMGGRWDATNVSYPVASVIVSLGRDHTDYLGNDLLSIAMEKLPIARKGVPLILGRIPKMALEVSRKKALSMEAQLDEWGKNFFTLHNGADTFHYFGERVIPNVRLAMKGSNQWLNASLAFRVLELLGLPIVDSSVSSLESVVLPGRFQSVTVDGVNIVLDVAHNPLGVKTLASNLDLYFHKRPVWGFLQVLRDKPWVDMLKLIQKHFEKVFFVKPEVEDERVLSLAEAGPYASSIDGEVQRMEEFLEIMAEARNRGGVLVFSGSFNAVRDGLRWIDGLRRR